MLKFTSLLFLILQRKDHNFYFWRERAHHKSIQKFNRAMQRNITPFSQINTYAADLFKSFRELLVLCIIIEFNRSLKLLIKMLQRRKIALKYNIFRLIFLTKPTIRIKKLERRTYLNFLVRSRTIFSV